jgi:hypothetical protein
MKNLLAFLAAALLVFVGVGLYLNWFHINRGPADTGHKAFSVDFNTDKIEKDVKKGGEKVVDAIEKAKAEADKKAQADRDAAANSANPETKNPENGKGAN